MKVLVIPTWYPSGKDKLMGNYHKDFTAALNKLGIEANMLHIDRQRISKPLKYLFMKKQEIEQELNYKVYKIKMLNWSFINYDLQQKLYLKKLEQAFKKYIKMEGKPDILHAHVTIPAGYAATKIGKKYGIPVIVTEHFSKYENFFTSSKMKKYSQFVLENATFSTVSNYMKEKILNYTSKCYVIPNLVDTKVFENSYKRKIDNQFNLVSCCALREGKKIENIFLAMEILINEGFKNIHLDIIGDGFLENYYKQECNRLNLNKYVTFWGRKSKKEISEIFLKEHALIISSQLESFAIPGIEALSSGLPVISTKCMGPEEYIDENCGVLCELNDPKDLSAAIKEVYNNYEKYNPEYLKSVANKFSEEQIIKNVKSIYQKMLKLYKK